MSMLPFPQRIDTLRTAFVEGGDIALRHVHVLGEGARAGTSLPTSAWDDSGDYGVKVVNIYAGSRARGLILGGLPQRLEMTQTGPVTFTMQ
ncbi:hypothetical protein [Paraburkholderia nodosa]|uniref:hypothetical protein n=1 Tax=Paraburkholderia nodosa TaxID=392320 RepID=UPI0012B68A53|nr:hypothetical protein [Paraburkholderia nodosa]